jgi:ABC-2 type transport system permease protein
MSVTALDLPSWPLADEREGLAEEVRTVGMVWEREAIRFFRTRTQILSSFIQPVLFLFVLGYGMSTLVGTAAGFDFKKFLFSGIAATTVMSTARCRLCRPAHVSR